MPTPAFNYGGIGATIGHEISHSFDNNGALFDSTGALRNWWTPADFAKFQQAGDALAKQYDAYEALPGLHVNGKLTLGENIADVAGLAASYDAYKASLNGKPAPVINGLTGDQRFFIAYAQSWATKMRDETLAQPHRDRRPRARQFPRADGAQPRRLVPGVQGPAGAETLSRARQAREGLGLVRLLRARLEVSVERIAFVRCEMGEAFARDFAHQRVLELAAARRDALGHQRFELLARDSRRRPPNSAVFLTDRLRASARGIRRRLPR